jgi:hypothetical protein
LGGIHVHVFVLVDHLLTTDINSCQRN